MLPSVINAPPPDLRILPIESIFPHEEHDSQRSEPLMKALETAEFFTNPPIVAPMGDGRFVVLDGANRYHCFKALGYAHLLVQVVDYTSEFIELSIWNHIISEWDLAEFEAELYDLPDTEIQQGWDFSGVAEILLHDGRALSLDASVETIDERNHTLRNLVHIYQRRAKLNRTTMTDPTKIWTLYPDAIAVVIFSKYQPQDIVSAAQHGAFLPPGVSRHIVNGRALKLFYPMDKIRDNTRRLEEKNVELQEWIRQKIANRGVRYYAESTYQFDE